MRKLLLLLSIALFSCSKVDQNTDPTGQKVNIVYEFTIESALVQPYDYLRPPTDGFGYVRSFEVDSFWTVSVDHYYTTDFRRAGFRFKPYTDTALFSARIIADGLLIFDTSGVYLDTGQIPDRFEKPFISVIKEW